MSTPYYPMYPADFEADTSHLTLEEDGAYNRILRLMWMTPGCSLPDDDRWIARRMRVDIETYERVILPLIDEFFKRSGGRIVSPRLRLEFEKVSKTYAKRSEAGKKGGRPKDIENKGKEEKVGLSREKAGPKQPEPEPYNTPIVPKGTVKRFEEFWDSYPHRNGVKRNRGGAEKKYKSAVRAGVSEQEIIDGVRKMKADPNVVRGYARDPSTWLNQRGWEDEITPQLKAVGGSSSRWGKL